MDNQISVDWNTIKGVFDRVPIFPITLIDVEILDYWHTHPSVWEVAHNLQHSQHVLAMVRYTLPSGHKGKPAIVYGVSFVYIPAHQAWTSLSDALTYLGCSKEDCVILVSKPSKLTYSPQLQRGKYFTLQPMNGDPDADRSPLSSFAAATLPVASREGCGGDMTIHIKLPPCFGSSKWPKMELIVESVLSRGPLWKNTNFVECNSSGEIIPGQTGQPLCQELIINLGAPGAKLQYTSTGSGHAPPLILAACHPSWDNYLNLNETVAEMAQRMMEEDKQQGGVAPKEGTIPKEKDTTKIMVLPPNDDTTFVPASEVPGAQYGLGTHENPVNLSDAPTEVSNTGTRPEGTDTIDESKILGHFSDALSEMAKSILDLEEGYFRPLHEVILKMEKALQDISRIDTHYISSVVMVMASWQEAVQAAMSHMENADLTIYLACWEDVQRAMTEYMTTVIKVREERDAAHAKKAEARKEAIKTGDPEDLVICLLDVTCKAACAQAEKVVDIFLTKIQETLWKHVPVSAQGPLITNALSTAFQFQMSVWQMIGDKSVHPLQAKHSDWCSLAGVIQAIVETSPKNCAIMFPPAPAPVVSFSTTFKPASSKEDDDDDSFGPGLHRFDSGSPTPSGSGCASFSCSPAYSPTPLPQGGCFIWATNQKKAPSSSLGTPPLGSEEPEMQYLDEDLDAGLEADNEGDGEKDQHGGDDSLIDASELEILQGLINPGANDQASIAPKSGEKWGSGHLDGSGSSDSSAEDLDTKGAWNRKKGLMPTKMASNTSQWTEEDINVVCQIRYKTDLDRFETYRCNKIKPEDQSTINTTDHSTYIEVAKADPSTVIKKSVFSMAAYREVLRLKGGDTSKLRQGGGGQIQEVGERIPGPRC